MIMPQLLEHIKQANTALREASNKSMDIAKQCAASRKAEISLPELPQCHAVDYGENPGYAGTPLWSAKQMREYGQACRSAALEEAEQACMNARLKTAYQPHREACAWAIRALKAVL